MDRVESKLCFHLTYYYIIIFFSFEYEDTVYKENRGFVGIFQLKTLLEEKSVLKSFCREKILL